MTDYQILDSLGRLEFAALVAVCVFVLAAVIGLCARRSG